MNIQQIDSAILLWVTAQRSDATDGIGGCGFRYRSRTLQLFYPPPPGQDLRPLRNAARKGDSKFTTAFWSSSELSVGAPSLWAPQPQFRARHMYSPFGRVARKGSWSENYNPISLRSASRRAARTRRIFRLRQMDSNRPVRRKTLSLPRVAIALKATPAQMHFARNFSWRCCLLSCRCFLTSMATLNDAQG